MTTASDVAVRNGHPGSTALAIRPGQEMFSDKQRAALAVLGIKDASNAELAVYMHYCQKTGLDPFSRQIYMICRREKQGDQWVAKQTIQVGIDGFRVIRDRIARREGITVEYEDTVWYDADGVPHNVWLWDEAPAACVVTVIKDGKRFPGAVRTAAYAATNRDGDMVAQWRTQPDHMIEKCAEAFALRRAFPHDLGGLYIDEEVPAAPPSPPARPLRVTAEDITGQQAPAPAGEPAAAAHERPLTKSALGRLRAAVDRLPALASAPMADVMDAVGFLAGRPVNLLEDLTNAEAVKVTKALDGYLQAAQGDIEEATSALWTAYRAEVAQADAEATQDPVTADA